MVDKVLAVTAVQQLAVPPNPGRVLLAFTNTGAADEIVYVSTTGVSAGQSAWTIYNRETLKMTLEHARKAWHIISSANVNVNVSEEFA